MSTVTFRKFNRKPTKRKTLDSDEDDEPTTTLTATDLRRQKKNQVTSQENKKEDLVVTFAASGTAASLDTDMATRQLDVDQGVGGTEYVKDPEQTVLAGEDAERAQGYQGLGAYKEYINKVSSSGIRYRF